MECEICGKPISDHPKRVKIDSSVMAVCDECAKFGRIQKEPPKPKFVKQQKKKSNKTAKKQQAKRRREEPEEELIEDYNEIIRKKRESKQWTREQLGQKINEKVSVINRIESGKMVPDTKLTKKLEKVLDIELLEQYNLDDLSQYLGSSGSGMKLGSIVKIKRK